MQVGKVYLVGAGPGHPKLLTLKAYELICTADVLLYDRLIPEAILADARPDAERIYVGKAPGLHQSRQEEIGALLVEAAHRARTVVRLKGGDPVLFGRGGEEAEFLAASGVPFEIVPGVTAGLSVPMAAGIPVTHREFASSVVLVTGHRRDDPDLRELDWGALARIDTIVFFMGVATLGEIARRLVENGRSSDTPAAVIQLAYWPDERVVVGPLGELPALARAAGIRPPATIVVGDVVKLRERLTTLHRDLRAGPDENTKLGLSPEGLLAKIEASARLAKDVAAAIRLRLFDDLERPRTVEDLAQSRGLAREPLGEILARLARHGLLLRAGEEYRDSEAALQFLRPEGGTFLGAEIGALIDELGSYDPVLLLTGASGDRPAAAPPGRR
jgi:uroporphyrin-III C-methyltransferase